MRAVGLTWRRPTEAMLEGIEDELALILRDALARVGR